MPRTKQLTDKQRKFIDAYCGPAKCNATLAARMAGYADPNAQGHQNYVKLGKYIKERLDSLQQANKRTIADQVEVMETLTRMMRGEETETVVANNGKAVEVPVKAQQRIKAAELIGKAYGMYTDKVETKDHVTIEIGVNNDYQ